MSIRYPAVAVDSARLAFSGLDLALNGLDLDFGLSLRRIRLRAERGTLVFREPIGLSLPSPARLLLEIEQDAIAAFLERQSPGGLKDFAVEARGGLLHVKATARVVFDVRAAVRCALSIEPPSQLRVLLEGADSVAAIARGMIEAQLEKVNPIIDLARLPFSAAFRSVEIEDGVVRLEVEIYGSPADP